MNEQQRDIDAYTDSLRLCNKELNRKLRMLITSLDEQTWTAFRNKEARLKASYERSTVIITGLIVFSIILLVILYLVIQRDIKIKAKQETPGGNDRAEHRAVRNAEEYHPDNLS